MFSVSSIHLVMDYNLPFILSNVFVLSLFCKIWAFDSSKLLSRNKSDFSVSTVFLGSVDSYLRLLWLNYLSDSISFLPAIAIINNGLYRCLLFSFSFLSARFFFVLERQLFLFWSGWFYSLNLPLVIFCLFSYLFGELSLYPTTGYFVFSFTSCFWLKVLFSDTLNFITQI